MAVKSVLHSLGISYAEVELGRVKLTEELNEQQLAQLNTALNYYELALMEDKKKILVERIKVVIIEMVHSPKDAVLVKLSEHLSKTIDHDYTYMANVFSAEEGSTIEKFYILCKVNRVKELLIYEGLTVTEASYRLNYSSVSHLCLQFKKITGRTPSVFVKLWESEKCAF